MRAPDVETPGAGRRAGAGEANTLSAKSTAQAVQVQGTQFVVLTTKTSGVRVVFGTYENGAEAKAVAARLVEVGGNAHVMEVAL